MNTATNPAEIPANVTLAQLGGSRRLKVMVGLRNAFHKNDGRTLVLYVMGGRAVEITLEASDLYTVTALRMRGLNVTRSAPVTDVGAEELIATLEAETGIAWRL